MTRAIKSLLLVPAVTFGIYACSGDDPEHGTGAPAGWQDVRTDPIDTTSTGTTDEALAALASALNRAPAADPSQAQTLSAPAAGELSRTTIPTFTWRLGSTSGIQKGVAPAQRFAVGDRTRDAFGLHVEHRALDEFSKLLGPIRVAHAHGTPFSGTGTLLTFSTSSNPKLLRIFTASSSFTPPATDWDRLVAANGFTLELVSAVFADNRILQDGGPYQGSKTEFTVAP